MAAERAWRTSGSSSGGWLLSKPRYSLHAVAVIVSSWLSTASVWTCSSPAGGTATLSRPPACVQVQRWLSSASMASSMRSTLPGASCQPGHSGFFVSAMLSPWNQPARA